jgi:group I intron endonuclease
MVAPYLVTSTDSFPCVYLMANRVTGKLYVGQARHFYNRVKGHKKKKHGWRLKNAVAEHGFNSFDWYVLERFDESLDRASLKRLLTAREQFYLDFFVSYDERYGYNLCPAAKSSLGYKHNEDSKAIIRAKRKIQADNGWISPTLGTHRPPHVKRACSEANRGKANRRRPVRQLDKRTGKVIREWNSVTEASKALGIAITQISSVALKRPKFSAVNNRWNVPKSAGGFGWEYVGPMLVGRWSKDDISDISTPPRPMPHQTRTPAYEHVDGSGDGILSTKPHDYKYRYCSRLARAEAARAAVISG